MKFFDNGYLKDKEIVKSLHQAAVDYDNGELAEVRDLLADIVNALDEFDKDYDINN